MIRVSYGFHPEQKDRILNLIDAASEDCRERTGHGFLHKSDELLRTSELFFAIDEEGVISGFALVRHFEVASIYVVPSTRRTGTGKTLLAEIKSVAPAGILWAKIHDRNLASQGLFAGAGFSKRDRISPGSGYYFWRVP